MQHNLEEIEFTEVVNDQGVTYAQFRTGLKPNYKKVGFDIAKGYFFLLLMVSAALFLTTRFAGLWWLILIPAAMLIGYIAAYLALFIHEAGHFNIYPDKKTNDRLANIFLCLPFGLSMKSYRKIHWQHHLHLGTPNDAEVSYFHALSKLFVVETLTGIHLLRTMNRKGSNTLLTKEQLTQSRVMLLTGALLHIVVLSVLIITGHWPVAVCWVLGFGIFFPFFATIRQILEHRDELAAAGTDFYQQPHGKVSRLFAHTILSSSFGAAGFTRHMIHHWDPQVSYTRLKDIEDFLLSSERTSALVKNSRTNYMRVVKKLMAAS